MVSGEMKKIRETIEFLRTQIDYLEHLTLKLEANSARRALYYRFKDRMSENVKELVRSHNTISAIKESRTELGLSLKEAKDLVEYYIEFGDWKQ